MAEGRNRTASSPTACGGGGPDAITRRMASAPPAKLEHRVTFGQMGGNMTSRARARKSGDIYRLLLLALSKACEERGWGSRPPLSRTFWVEPPA